MLADDRDTYITTLKRCYPKVYDLASLYSQTPLRRLNRIFIRGDDYRQMASSDLKSPSVYTSRMRGSSFKAHYLGACSIHPPSFIYLWAGIGQAPPGIKRADRKSFSASENRLLRQAYSR